MPIEFSKTARPYHYDPTEIPVEFLVLHYTSASMDDTLKLFLESSAVGFSHLIIGLSGNILEVVDCMDGKCVRAWHAGESYWHTENKEWKNFNDFSIGIELISANGNFFNYTQEQYESLRLVIQQLKSFYPALKDPHRVVGHEHIAGHRGKVDPGYCFNWPLFFKMNYAGQTPIRKPVLNEKNRKYFLKKVKTKQKNNLQDSLYWMELNQAMEKAHAFSIKNK